MLKGFTENGDLKDVMVTEEGEILVKIAGSGDEGLNVNILNSGDLAVKEKTTLYAGVSSIGLNEITIGVNDVVSEISIANYSETANVYVSVDNKNYVIAPEIALDLPINKIVNIIGLSADEEDTTVQYVVKGFVSTDEDTTKYYPPDWSELGYESTPQIIIDGFNYSKEIYDNFDDSITSAYRLYQNNLNLLFMPLVDTLNITNMSQMFDGCLLLMTVPKINMSNVTNTVSMFSQCQRLISVPKLDTLNVTNMSQMFAYCIRLKNVPQFDTRSVTNFNLMFRNCSELSDESLDNILAMCINATNYSGTKTLQTLGISSSQADICQTLSNWEAFVEAGWSSGY